MNRLLARVRKAAGLGPVVDLSAGFFATLGFLLASTAWDWWQAHPSNVDRAPEVVSAELPYCRSESP